MPGLFRARIHFGRFGALLCAATALGTLTALPARADVVYTVTVDTSSVNATTGFLDFQFNPGNGTSQAATAPPDGTSNAGTVFGLGLYDSGEAPILTSQGSDTGFAGQVDINLNGTTTPTAFPANDDGAATVVSIQPQAVPNRQRRSCWAWESPGWDSFAEFGARAGAPRSLLAHPFEGVQGELQILTRVRRGNA